MLTPAPSKVSHTYFKNAVGELLAHPLGHYITVTYYTGPRQPADLLAFIAQAGQMLARWGWDKLSSELGQMPPLSPAEEEWLAAFWYSHPQPYATVLYGALLLPHAMFARLSWRSKVSSLPARSSEWCHVATRPFTTTG